MLGRYAMDTLMVDVQIDDGVSEVMNSMMHGLWVKTRTLSNTRTSYFLILSLCISPTRLKIAVCYLLPIETNVYPSYASMI